MLSQWLVLPITKIHFLLVDSGTITTYSPLNTKFSLKHSLYPKINENFLNSKLSKVMTKIINKAKKDKFGSDNRFLF